MPKIDYARQCPFCGCIQPSKWISHYHICYVCQSYWWEDGHPLYKCYWECARVGYHTIQGYKTATVGHLLIESEEE